MVWILWKETSIPLLTNWWRGDFDFYGSSIYSVLWSCLLLQRQSTCIKGLQAVLQDRRWGNRGKIVVYPVCCMFYPILPVLSSYIPFSELFTVYHTLYVFLSHFPPKTVILILLHCLSNVFCCLITFFILYDSPWKYYFIQVFLHMHRPHTKIFLFF